MKLSSVCLSTLALALVNASPIAHKHHEHAKRDVVTIMKTVTAIAGQEAPATTSSTTAAETTPATTYEEPATTSSYPSTTLSTAIASSSTSSAAEASSSSSLSGNAAAAVGAKGINYSPYTVSGSCKTADEIQSDIAKLSDFDVIRVYAPDCSVVENIFKAKTSSQKLFAGLYYLDSLSTDIETLSSAISSAGSWDEVYAVSIGNEWVNSGTYTVSQVSAAVSSGRSLLSAAGYSGDVVSVDTLVAVQDNSDLCEYSDFIAVNSHPYWDGSVEAADSGSWLKQQISNIKSICGGSKSVLITETGWPTQGESYGVAVPSEENQYSAIKSIVEEVGDQVILFTTYNDFWKSAGDYGVEQYWGILGDSPN